MESREKYTLEWIQNEINYYNEMCISVSYFDYLDALKEMQRLQSENLQLRTYINVLETAEVRSKTVIKRLRIQTGMEDRGTM